MTTETSTAGTAPVGIGAVHLDVVDLERSLRWWREVVGLTPIEQTADAVALGAGGEPFLVLHRGARSPARAGYTGLFHLAIYLPDEVALGHALARLAIAGERFSGTDHLVAKSLYTRDPNGIGLELAHETPDRVRSVRWPETERSPEIVDADGRLRDGMEPLDLTGLATIAREADPSQPAAAGTTIGHIHLAVADLEEAFRFYRDVLGFSQINYAPLAGYGDLGQPGSLLHEVALNTWRTAGAPPRPPGTAGLNRFRVRYESPEQLGVLTARLERADAEAEQSVIRDPAGNAIELSAPAAVAG